MVVDVQRRNSRPGSSSQESVHSRLRSTSAVPLTRMLAAWGPTIVTATSLRSEVRKTKSEDQKRFSYFDLRSFSVQPLNPSTFNPSLFNSPAYGAAHRHTPAPSAAAGPTASATAVSTVLPSEY